MGIYTANFGIDFPVRFVVRNGVLHVCKSDFIDTARSCFAEGADAFAGQLLDDALRFLGESQDHTSALIGVDEIGAVVHWHLAGNLLVSLSELRNEENIAMRETAYRIHTLMLWLTGASSEASDFFGIGLERMLQGVKSRLDRINPAIVVHVSLHDEWFVAECDALHLVTEAKSFEALTESAWELVPDLIELNNLPFDPSNMRLCFELQQEARDHRMVN